MNDSQLFAKIAIQMQPILPVSWKKLCLYADVSEDSYEISYYVFIEDRPEPIQCYDLPLEYQISEEDIDSVFASLAELLQKSKNENNQTWTVFTFVLSADGTVDVYYDYNDHSDNAFSYKKEWKKTYVIL